MLCMENTRVVGTVVERGRITTNARDVVAEWRKREKKRESLPGWFPKARRRARLGGERERARERGDQGWVVDLVGWVGTKGDPHSTLPA